MTRLLLINPPEEVEAALRATPLLEGGLLVARKIVDEMIYNEQGNEVLLIKHFVY